jgi:hypothetical protein
MHELLRIYGRDHLPPAGQRQVIAALAGYFASALGQPHDDPAWLDDQWDNIFATAVAAAARPDQATEHHPPGGHRSPSPPAVAGGQIRRPVPAASEIPVAKGWRDDYCRTLMRLPCRTVLEVRL